MSDHTKKTQANRPVTPDGKNEYAPRNADVELELQKSKWGGTFLTRAIKDAERNVQITYIRKPGYFEMLDDLAELMQKANTHLTIPTSDLSKFVVVLLFGRTIGSFVAAVRLATSGQVTESYPQLRACLENALYAFYIKNDPTLANIWLDRHENRQAKETTKDHFKIGNAWKSLKSKDASLEKRTHEAYETCIDYGAHPNERSVTMNVEASKEAGVTLLLFNTKDIVLDLSLLTMVHIMLCVVEMFEKVFPEQFEMVNSRECRRSIKEQHDRIAPGVIAKLGSRAKEGSKQKKV